MKNLRVLTAAAAFAVGVIGCETSNNDSDSPDFDRNRTNSVRIDSSDISNDRSQAGTNSDRAGRTPTGNTASDTFDDRGTGSNSSTIDRGTNRTGTGTDRTGTGTGTGTGTRTGTGTGTGTGAGSTGTGTGTGTSSGTGTGTGSSR